MNPHPQPPKNAPRPRDQPQGIPRIRNQTQATTATSPNRPFGRSGAGGGGDTAGDERALGWWGWMAGLGGRAGWRGLGDSADRRAAMERQPGRPGSHGMGQVRRGWIEHWLRPTHRESPPALRDRHPTLCCPPPLAALPRPNLTPGTAALSQPPLRASPLHPRWPACWPAPSTPRTPPTPPTPADKPHTAPPRRAGDHTRRPAPDENPAYDPTPPADPEAGEPTAPHSRLASVLRNDCADSIAA